MMSKNMEPKLISINCPASNFIKAGVKIGAQSVAQDVIEMDKATFALAIYAITFEAKPLGEQPTRRTPAAISGGKSNVLAIAKPKKGMMVNWQISPTTTALGMRTTPKKSSFDIVVPMPNMMTWSKKGMNFLSG